MMSVRPIVVICGPASWNHLILRDHLPEPVPHMQFARRSWHTLGGTSAAKALHLADLGIDVRLCAAVGADEAGGRVHDALTLAGVAVFMNDDRTDDPWELMRSCLARGPRLAVCTRGAQGAIALEVDGTRHDVAASPAHVVDTNGAGYAFMAGFMGATLRGASIADSLGAASAQARVAIESEHLHPVLGR